MDAKFVSRDDEIKELDPCFRRDGLGPSLRWDRLDPCLRRDDGKGREWQEGICTMQQTILPPCRPYPLPSLL